MFQANFVCTLALEVVSSMFLACFLLTPITFPGTSQDIYKNNSCFEKGFIHVEKFRCCVNLNFMVMRIEGLGLNEKIFIFEGSLLLYSAGDCT